ncbi:MAG: Isoquinoline 1-oxidoreductase beta subunit, partial [Phenylobacterium sp.]|nr:Isoquinoline 1-oxidoreductase beta subunit [Phenylobacterium sp.]
SRDSAMLGFFAGRSTSAGRLKPLLQAGASARERLKLAAAQTWKVPVSEVEAKESVLTHRRTGRKLRYGQVAALAATVVLDKEPTPKPRSQWTLLGKATPGKINNAAIVKGAAQYGMDVRLPNMLYAALLQSPVQGGRLKSYDFEAIRKMPGLHSVVVVDPAEPRAKLPFAAPLPISSSVAQSAVAVVADHYWQARKALEALPVVWDDGDGARWKTTEQMQDAALAACDAPGKVATKVGDAPAALAAGKGLLVEAAYLTPYCDHVAIEPLNGTAMVTPERVDLWHPSQHSQQAFCVAAEESGVDPKNVYVHQTFVGGGFGRRVFGDDVRMVVAVAKKVPGRPVHVIWSREEVIRQGRYRPLEAAKLTARLDEHGMPAAIRARTAGASFGLTGLNDSVYAGGAIPNFQVESANLPIHLLTGPYRGPGYNSNAFIIESFIDECAAAAKIDPLEYRLKLLAAWPDPYWAKCLKEVAVQSGWGGKLPRGQGRGVAISNWSGGGKPNAGTTVAAVARVEVSKTGVLSVRQIDLAMDPGGIVNQDAVLTQLEGGAIYGLNMTLNEGLTVKDGRIVESNYHDYPMVRMGDVPTLRVHFGGVSNGERFSEAGEAPVGPIGPAIANAIFAATGKRIRQTPFRKQDLSWA